jgi:hypothetical protein
MGYSVVVQFKNEKDRNQALAILLNNEELWINKYEFGIWIRGPVVDPAYSGELKDPMLGFDFHKSGDPASQIAYYLCYWIADNYDSEIYYDGDELIEKPKNPERSLVKMINRFWPPDGKNLWKIIKTICNTLDTKIK